MIFRKALLNSVFLLSGRLIFRFTTAATIIIAARFLGVELYGQLETGMAFANIFLVFFDLGMGTLMVREGTKNTQAIREFFGNTLFVELVMSVVLYGAMIFTAFQLNYDPNILKIIITIGGALLIFEYRRAFRGIYSILLKMNVSAGFETFTGIILLVLVFIIALAIPQKQGLNAIAFAYLITYTLSNIIFFSLCLKKIRPTLSLKKIPAMVKEAYPFALSAAFVTIYFQIDQVMISLIEGSREVALYSAAAKLVTFLLFIPRMTYEAILPTLYKLYHEKSEKLKRAHDIMTRYFTALGLPLGIGMILLPEEIIHLLYGSGFSGAEVAMQLFGVFTVIRFMGSGASNILTSVDKQMQKVWVQVGTLVLNIVFNYILIHRYGFVGAAIATLTVETIMTIFFIRMARKATNSTFFAHWKSHLRSLLAGSVLAAAIILTKEHTNVIILVIGGGILYGVILFISGFFTPHDRKLFQQLVPKKSSPTTT
ncbi:MAG: hypothetical protein A3F54_05250 [Candidatus Kerfeldbacteria bacterium RIFCSPHIGHO2_12_FULL_48_17]|uniref:Uncharacterized protein n=1 Tax=Candidatus Kerfeldbacteria bacterium RIFCSPHIGHO2_12_FULL_48_17 TaxID=1798542 RepID=A0A1G2B3L2_9BACT|nr:MAG: hypothetical protein A3F54_05250 [Candidatus Kerfeldbacteria bacterium RIFCSPHIGHO2_12_FULL_48_17]